MDQPLAYVRGSGDVKSSPKQANRSIQTALFAAQSGYVVWFRGLSE